MRVIGFSATSPIQVYKALAESRERVSLLSVEERLSQVLKNYVIVVPGMDTLRKNIVALKNCRKITVCVCDSFFMLKSCSINVADVKSTKGLMHSFSPSHFVDISNAVNTAQEWNYKYKKQNVAFKLLRKTQHSMVGQLQNFLFRVSDTEKREQAKQFLFNALSNGNLDKVVIEFSKQFKKHPGLPEVLKLLTSTDMVKFVKALERVQDGDTVNTVSEELKVSKFDLNYSLSYLRKRHNDGNEDDSQ